MQTTLIIYKPDCIAKQHVGNVLERFEKAGFSIVGCKMMRLTQALVQEHYAHIADKPFYPPLEKFMLSSPVIVMALHGKGVIGRVRELMGPTDSRKAPKGTIRGDFGTDSMANIVHASDSLENARIELDRFFKPEELFGEL
ncbi:MAG: nucleoside-diphosphate kinase [Nibricoccus sp.]